MLQTIRRIKSNNRVSEQGFTMIEVLIAMAIFAIGILGVAALQIASVRGNVSARNVTDIATWASDRVEKLMALPYDDNWLAPGVHSLATDLTFTTDGIDNNYNGLIDEGGETGPLTIRWQVFNDVPIDNTKTITITVEHGDPRLQRSVDITRVIPRIV